MLDDEIQRTTKENIRRLWAKVLIAGEFDCWEWQGAAFRPPALPYGVMTLVGGRNRYLHRMMFETFSGDIPPGMCVCHSCDNPICCNPNHLFLGTINDNTQDMIRKRRGRGDINQAHWTRRVAQPRLEIRLTEEQSAAIVADPRPSKTVAKSYGIHRATIDRVKQRARRRAAMKARGSL